MFYSLKKSMVVCNNLFISINTKDTSVEYKEKIDNTKIRIWASCSVRQKGDCEITG